tara:strand:- start:1262 stop:3004 length:1743 start_codon:yes stop_codon:yes gene_type:complete
MSLLEQASLILTPNGFKESKLYSVVPSDGAGDMTVVRATTATRVNENGLIETVPKNLLTYSNTFSNAAWFNINTTETSGQSGYDGSNNAWLLQRSAAYGLIRQFVDSDGDTTFSVYVKKGSLSWVRLYIASNTLSSDVYINLENGAIGTKTGSPSVEVVDLGSGWYRCTISKNTTLINNFRIYPAASNEDTTGTSGNIYIQDAQLEQGSTATSYFPTTNRLNIPRIDYTSGEGAILVEGQRTNLALYSEQFDNAAWTKFSTTISANTTTSPDGTTNADKIIEVVATADHGFYKLLASGFSANSLVTISVFAKFDGRHLQMKNSYLSDASSFNLQSGTVVSNYGSGVGEIVSYGNGWYRCILKTTANSSGNAGLTAYLLNSVYATTYAGNGTSGIYIYGAQLEAGSYATSYIPTVASSVTRNADVISKTGISSLIGQTEGTVFFNGKINSNDITIARNITLSDGTSANRIILGFGANASNGPQAELISGGVGQASGLGLSMDMTTEFKFAFAYATNNFRLYVNGVLIGSDLSGVTYSGTTLNTLSFANFANSANFLDGKVKNLQLYKTALTNAELATLTTL